MKTSTDAATLTVRVQPRASRNSLTVQPDGTLRIRLTAPPVGGEANAALVIFLAESLDVPKRSIEVVAGKAGRTKLVRIHGMSENVARARISALGAASAV